MPIEPASSAPTQQVELRGETRDRRHADHESAASANAPKVHGIWRPSRLISEMFFLCVAT
jgi:hypothetical protein